MRIAVLGSGPAGMLATHACLMSGHDVTIFSKTREPSPISGAQYLHESIPALTGNEPNGEIVYHKIGDKSGYATKVYGDPDAPTSWDLFPTGPHPYWRLREAYLGLHNEHFERINKTTIGVEWLNYLEERRDMFQLVVSAIPAPVLCQKNHRFDSTKVLFEKHNHVDKNLGENYIFYSGDVLDPWYRSSMIAGNGWWEYGTASDPYMYDHEKEKHSRELTQGIKPLDTNCNCRPRIIRVGRFGEWKKGKLVHHAFWKTLDALEVTHALQ